MAKNKTQKSQNMVVFDKKYYDSIMREFGYDPIEFEKIDFSLRNLKRDDLQRRWLCHHDGNIFSSGLEKGNKSIVATGLGLSGVPHAGTMSQILRSITLQEAGVPVQMVLGDLDAYNGKMQPLKTVLELAERYKKFVSSLGFKQIHGSVLRSQFERPDVLRTSYLIGHFMEDRMFNKAEEDLHSFYSKRGKVDSQMSYRRKLSLNLMTADFIHLGLEDGYKNVLVMLGIDEHKYVEFGRENLRRIKEDGQFENLDMTMSAMYSPIIKGFYGYPKMSKSFPESAITADMRQSEIKERIIYGEGKYDKPENNVVYQMMASASFYCAKDIKSRYELCLSGGDSWNNAKKEYADVLVEVCSKW